MSILSVEAPPMSRVQIRTLASQVRDALGFRDRIFVDVGALLEFILPNVLPGFTYDVKSIEEMGNDHGLAEPDINTITLREDVYINALDGKGRDRATVLHELAHILLHKSDRISHRRAHGPPKAYQDPEWQAKVFAGEFLVPVHLIGSFTKVSDVARECGVSLDAARMQLKAYVKEGLISKGQITDLAS
jgi:hypothetical protein